MRERRWGVHMEGSEGKRLPIEESQYKFRGISNVRSPAVGHGVGVLRLEQVL